MKKRTIIGLAVLTVVVVAIGAVVATNTPEDGFSREGKTVDASAESLLPSIGSFPTSWNSSSTTIGGSVDDVKSSVDRIYIGSGINQYLFVSLYVYNTVENAKNAYSLAESNTSGTSYSKFEQSFKYTEGFFGSHYVFQDMNVYGEVYSIEILSQGQWDKIMGNIEGKIQNNAR